MSFSMHACREVDAEAKRILEAVGIPERMLSTKVRMSDRTYHARRTRQAHSYATKASTKEREDLPVWP